MKLKAIIILSGYNTRAIIAFMRVCIKNNIPFFIIAQGVEDPIMQTKYKTYVSYVRTDRSLLGIKEIISRIMKDNNLDHVQVLPSTEYLNRFLIKNKEELEKSKIYVPLVDKNLYEKISDKLRFVELCKDSQILTPLTYSNIDDIKYPCIFKPKDYNSYMGKPIRINCRDEMNQFIQTYKFEEWFAQEYITGKSYYLLFYFKADGNVIATSQENLVQSKGGGSIILAKTSNIHMQNICMQYKQMLIGQGFKGLIMIELRECNDKYYMIEANPRLWGPSQLFVDAKVPLFEHFIEDMGYNLEISIDKNEEEETWYFWNEGLILSCGKENYYNYSREQMLQEYERLLSIEIYNRQDTKRLCCRKRINNDF